MLLGITLVSLIALLQPALTQGVIWPGSTQDGAGCQNLPQGKLPVFYDFQNASTSSQGLLPFRSSCASWTMPLDLTSPQCNATSSKLLIEMWLTDGNQTLDRRQTVEGVYLLANMGGVPSVQVLSNGDITVGELSLYSPASPLQGSYLADSQGMDANLPFHRITVPVGSLLQQPGIAQWSLTLVAASQLPSSYGYALRATCMPAAALPCPRPAAGLGACNGPFRNSSASKGQCNADTNACACPLTNMDPACGTPVLDLTSGETNNLLRIPGGSWNYFFATGQAYAVTRLLAELTKPPGSAESYLPALVLSSRGLPDINSIDFGAYDLQDSCGAGGGCSTCDCYVPAQAQDLLYASRVQQAGGAPSTWFLGVFNALPPGTVLSNAMKLRTRMAADAVQPPPLCPADCSGAGACLPDTRPPTGPDDPAPYSCACQPGFSGPYCQGPSQTIQLSGYGFDSTKLVLASGQWQFYIIPASPPSQATVTWLPSSSGPLMFFSPIYGNGSQFFSPNETDVYNSTGSFALPQSSKPYGWTIAVLNSDAVSPSVASYRLILSQQAPSPTISFTSLLQMALIGSVSGFAILFLCFMLVKVVVMRRNNQHALAGMLAGSNLHAMQAGVPAEVMATFPLFKFGASSKEALQPKGGAPPAPAQAQRAGSGRPVSGRAGSGRAGSGRAGSGRAGSVTAAGTPPCPCVGWQRVDATGSQLRSVGSIQQLEGGGIGGEELQCSVCIADFEVGEMLRQLPCRHVFHQSCIDPWMMQHTTCPNCRWLLCPSEDRDGGPEADVEAGPSSVAPASPRPALPRSSGSTRLASSTQPSLVVAPVAADAAAADAAAPAASRSRSTSPASRQSAAAGLSQPQQPAGRAGARASSSSIELSGHSAVIQVSPRGGAASGLTSPAP